MHDHDAKWVNEQLEALPYQMRAKVMERYSEAYKAVISANVGFIGAEGLARREANTRLREYVKKYRAAYGGAVIRPPTI